MDTKSTWRATPQIVLGLLIVVVGVIFTLDNLDIIYAHDYLRYWPALVVIYGISKMIQPRGRPGRFFGLIVTFVGAALLIDRLDFFYFRLWDFWPLIIVAVGLSMIWRRSKGPGSPDHMATLPPDTDSIINGTAVLSGFRRTSSSQDFRGGELTAIMGGCEIDLRQASIKEGDAVIDVFAFWGGIDLKIPLDWSVVVQGSPLLGGFDDKTRPPQGGSAKRLVIKGYAIMGGVQISN